MSKRLHIESPREIPANAQYAVRRDLLTGEPLEKGAQIMTARWYADTKRDGTAPVGAMTRTRRYDVLASGPASALDEEMGDGE